MFNYIENIVLYCIVYNVENYKLYQLQNINSFKMQIYLFMHKFNI